MLRLLGGDAGAELRLLEVSLLRALPGWSRSWSRFFLGCVTAEPSAASPALSPLSLFSAEPSFLSAACLRDVKPWSADDADVPLGLSLSSCLITFRLRGFDGEPSFDKTIVSASELPSVPPSSSCLSRDEDAVALPSRVDVGDVVRVFELRDRSLFEDDDDEIPGFVDDFGSLEDGGTARDKVGDLFTDAAEEVEDDFCRCESGTREEEAVDEALGFVDVASLAFCASMTFNLKRAFWCTP